MIRRPITRWHGGKFVLARWIISSMPPHRVYTESFGGGASVLMRKQPAEREVLSDLDPLAVNLYRVLADADQSRDLAFDAWLTPYRRSVFRDIAMLAASDDPIHRARSTLIRGAMAFSPSTHSGYRDPRKRDDRSTTMKRTVRKTDPMTRSQVMSRVLAKDTKPEVRVRKALHAAGLRYRLHRKDLPGRPDIVLPSRRTVVFVHGCFWHRHPGCPRCRTPKTRQEFWIPKLEANIDRDRKASAALIEAGWRVRTIWECETERPDTLSEFVDDVVSLGNSPTIDAR